MEMVKELNQFDGAGMAEQVINKVHPTGTIQYLFFLLVSLPCAEMRGNCSWNRVEVVEKSKAHASD